MPEEDESAGEVDETQEILCMIFPTHHQAAKVIEPGEHPFDFPAATIPAQAPAILGPALRPASSTMRRDHFRRELSHHLLIKFVTVVGFVADQALGASATMR